MLWQSSATALPVCSHALPVALPVFQNKKTKTVPKQDCAIARIGFAVF